MSTAPFVLICDDRVRAVPLFDNGEPLVSLRGVGGRVWVETSGAFAAQNSPHYHLARQQVCSQVQRAASALPDGLALLVLEAYRPPSHQSMLFERWRSRMAAEHPQADAMALERLTAQFVAPLDVAGHPAGAALDLTLCDAHGRPLDMGSPPNEALPTSALDAPGVDLGARARRALMRDVLAAQGFVNYPSEWWHWSFGDRYWAFVSRAPAALYGAIEETALSND
jgi:zinc D-Ala-D-Ala dipeptidase